jgi:HlyD family secretion protein
VAIAPSCESEETMTTRTIREQDELARIVAEGSDGGRSGRNRRRVVVAALLGVVAAASLAIPLRGRAATPQFHTGEVTRGDLVVTVSATGTLQPTNQIDVGSEVSGLVESVFVDDNDRVRTGEVLARLDVSRLQDQVVNMKAALASAEARVAQAEATVQESRATLTRLRQLGDLTSPADRDAAEATAARAAADDASARAAVEQSRAALSSAEVNLAKASICSPIDGVVLARQIEPGQTVAASFQAPVLFTLAEDLKKMELQVDVDEADVGRVREGQAAVFTVDAYTDRHYPARIERVAYGSQTKDGVVSYKTILSVDNEDLSLRPGMTATAEITTLERRDVLLVPNAALRFTPPATARSQESTGSLVSSLLPRPPRARSRSSNGGGGGTKKVWVLRDGQPVGVPVTVGPSDGHLTELRGGEVVAGTSVITETEGAAP